MSPAAAAGEEPGLPDVLGYRLVVFDLDGTLYRQGPVRRGMLAEILAAPPEAGPGRPLGRLARLSLLRRFRRLREEISLSAPEGFDAALFARLARETGRGEPELRALAHDWMERRPLPRLMAARVPGAAELIAALRARGRAVAVWSDYPVTDKLAALGIEADHHLWAGDPGLGALKPDPAGLRLAMARAGAAPEETLMVGDRLSHDGAAAKAAGVDFLLRADRRPRRSGPRQHHLRDFRALVPAPAPGA